MIAETKNPVALADKKSVTARVSHKMLVLEMLAAINLDYQFGSMGHEVDDVRADRGLTAKTDAVGAMSAQRTPNDPLSMSRIPTESPGAAAY